MRHSLKPLVAGLCVLGIMSSPSFSAVSNTSAAELKTLQTEAGDLKKELAELRAEVKSLRSQVRTEKKVSSVKSSKKAAAKHTGHSSAGVAASANVGESRSPDEVEALLKEQEHYLPFDPDLPGQSLVSTGPYIGVPITFAGESLVVNTPSVNQDVTLLNMRKKIHNRLAEITGINESPLYHTHLLLSGVVEGQAMYSDIGGGANTSDIDLTNVSLDALLLGPTEWTSAFIEFSYNNGTSGTSNFRAGNSSVFVNKAFIILGDFSKTPFYATIGQFYVPFGTYASVMVSPTLPKSLARTKERALQIGYQQQAEDMFYAAAYIFRGDSHASSVSRINNGGLNAGYKFKTPYVNADIGAGLLGNIADSVGMQQTGNPIPTFGGFGSTTNGNELLVHRVPAYDLHAYLDIGPDIDLIGEFIGTTTDFNPTDLSMNGRGAKPWALDLEASYSLSIFDFPSAIGVGYGKTKDAAALGLPLNRYSLVFNTSLLRNTLQSLEIRRDTNYAASTVSSGSGFAGPTPSGQQDTVVTAQIDYYF